MPHSILEAIKEGIWDFEPDSQVPGAYPATGAMPGTDRKLEVLAARIQQGLPLWHPSDRSDYDQVHSDYDNN